MPGSSCVAVKLWSQTVFQQSHTRENGTGLIRPSSKLKKGFALFGVVAQLPPSPAQIRVKIHPQKHRSFRASGMVHKEGRSNSVFAAKPAGSKNCTRIKEKVKGLAVAPTRP